MVAPFRQFTSAAAIEAQRDRKAEEFVRKFLLASPEPIQQAKPIRKPELRIDPTIRDGRGGMIIPNDGRQLVNTGNCLQFMSFDDFHAANSLGAGYHMATATEQSTMPCVRMA